MSLAWVLLQYLAPKIQVLSINICIHIWITNLQQLTITMSMI